MLAVLAKRQPRHLPQVAFALQSLDQLQHRHFALRPRRRHPRRADAVSVSCAVFLKWGPPMTTKHWGRARLATRASSKARKRFSLVVVMPDDVGLVALDLLADLLPGELQHVARRDVHLDAVASRARPPCRGCRGPASSCRATSAPRNSRPGARRSSLSSGESPGLSLRLSCFRPIPSYTACRLTGALRATVGELWQRRLLPEPLGSARVRLIRNALFLLGFHEQRRHRQSSPVPRDRHECQERAAREQPASRQRLFGVDVDLRFERRRERARDAAISE